MGGTSYDDGATSADAVAEALKTFTPVSTSRPAPHTFAEAYATCAKDGAESVVSIHLSGDMSGTFEAAMIGAKESPIPVRVVDSRSLGMGLGFPVLAAAAAAAAGEDQAGVEAAARARMKSISAYFYVDTLEYLRRGGRIGAAQAMIGSAFSIKPLLTVKDGEVAPLARVPGTRRALAKMVDLAVKKSGGFRADIAVTRFGASDHELEIGRQIERRVPAMVESMVVEASTVIGAHLGPGALGITVSPVG